MTNVTRILNAIEEGDLKAASELLPLIYEELRLFAAQKMSHELPGQTLQATALVHEAYIRLVGEEVRNWDSAVISFQPRLKLCVAFLLKMLVVRRAQNMVVTN